jgi:hypothetical protein
MQITTLVAAALFMENLDRTVICGGTPADGTSVGVQAPERPRQLKRLNLNRVNVIAFVSAPSGMPPQAR